MAVSNLRDAPAADIEEIVVAICRISVIFRSVLSFESTLVDFCPGGKITVFG